MSAIAAVLHLDGRPVARELIARLTEAMAVNGPDGRHVWVDGAVGLGCASFYTVPEQLQEPMPLVSGTRTLVLDGRIDNRDELRRECARRGAAVAEDAGDGAYVIAAYDVWGVDSPAHLIGEWAFVLWDGAEQRLIAARDHIARRSLRWWSDGHTLIVSSQFPGILEHPDVRAEPNEAVVAEWLAGTPATIEETLWSGVRNVPGGRRLVSVRGHPPRLDRYWNPSSEAADPIRNVADAVDAMRSTVTEAVRAHLRCIGTPEVELSGGWDSSTVAAVAHKLHVAGHGPNFRLSSAVFPTDRLIDETPYIEAMERQLGRASIKRPYAPAPFDDLVAAVRESRHPWRRDDWRAIRATNAHRVTVTGDGGDETLGGMWRSAPAVLAHALLTRRSNRTGVHGLLESTVRPHIRPLLPRYVRVMRSVPTGPGSNRGLIRRTSLVDRFVDAEPKWTRATLRRRRDPRVARQLERPSKRPDTRAGSGTLRRAASPTARRPGGPLGAQAAGACDRLAAHRGAAPARLRFRGVSARPVTGRTWGTEFRRCASGSFSAWLRGSASRVGSARQVGSMPLARQLRERAMTGSWVIGPLACCTLWSYGYRTRHHRSNETALHRSSGERRGLVGDLTFAALHRQHRIRQATT